jgi:hypothetical protein
MLQGAAGGTSIPSRSSSALIRSRITRVIRRLGLGDQPDRDPRGSEALHAPHLGLLDDRAVLTPDLVCHALDRVARAVDVRIECDLDVEQRARPVLGHVSGPLDLPVGDVPHRAVDRTDLRRP